MFIPSKQEHNSIESFIFNYETTNLYNKINLIKFILFNSANPSTLVNFITSNKLAHNSDLLQIVQSKLRVLQEKKQLLNNKILLSFENMNKTNLQLIENNYDLNQIDNNKLDHTVNIYEYIYLKNIQDSLIVQLNRYLHEINLLKQFEKMFI